MADGHRPRGGQVWRDADGREVQVVFRQTVNPMAEVRPHSDMRWSLVAFADTDNPNRGGVMHERDFCGQFTFMRGKR